MTKDNYHDKGYKELLSKKRNFIKFLRHFVKNEWVELIDEDSLHLCDKGFVDSFFKELESDLIYSAKIADRDVYFYILTELQSSIDFTMPFRLLKYIWAILLREFNNTPEDERKRADFRLPLVIPIVFYNGEDKWFVKRSFKDYLQAGDLFEGVIDFQYTLVDINLLEREYLLKNHDAICAVIAMDKVRGREYGLLFDTLIEIIHSKQGFDPDEFRDFLVWLKHTIKFRTASEEEADKIIELIEEGDEIMMRTGIDILFDNAEAIGEARGRAQGMLEAAVQMLNKGMDILEIANILNLSDEQVEQVETKAGISTC